MALFAEFSLPQGHSLSLPRDAESCMGLELTTAHESLLFHTRILKKHTGFVRAVPGLGIVGMTQLMGVT